jgi:mannose-6-phosphate isomerase-like protein (cupin superfamily)
MDKFEPFTEVRPWGEFRQFTAGEPSTVKLIFVKAGEALSRQRHKLRTEHWVVVAGRPEVTVGSEIRMAEPGDEFTILPETEHRLAASAEDAIVLEIAIGSFDENDIERLEDRYGRV